MFSFYIKLECGNLWGFTFSYFFCRFLFMFEFYMNWRLMSSGFWMDYGELRMDLKGDYLMDG